MAFKRRHNFKLALMLSTTICYAPQTLANVVGGDLQNFNPAASGIDYVTVHSAETLEPGYANLGFMLNHAINSLPHFEDESQTGRLDTGDTLTMTDVSAGIGVLNNFELGGAFQTLVRQTVDKNIMRGQFSKGGIINYRLYGKWRIYEKKGSAIAVIGSGVFNRVRNNPYVGKDGSPVTIFEIAADTSLLGINLAANIGYRSRKKGTPIAGYMIQPVGNQYLASVGASYLLPLIDTKLIVEAYGARPAEKDTTGLRARQGSSAELLAGIKHDVTDDLALHIGGATEAMNGVSSPDWRAYAGINWSFGAPPQEPQPVAPPPPVQAVAQAEVPAQPPTPPAPQKKLMLVTEQEERAILRNVNFKSGSDELPESAVSELRNLATEINAGSFEMVYIEGHTDSVGSAESNLTLSNRRAESIRKWLITNAKIPEGKIKAAGYGESRPIADNGNRQGRYLNRRVEVRVMRQIIQKHELIEVDPVTGKPLAPQSKPAAPSAPEVTVPAQPGAPQAPAATQPDAPQAPAATQPDAPQVPAATQPDAPQAPAATQPDTPQAPAPAAEAPSEPSAAAQPAKVETPKP
jgi:outer membrane protein OmpA-like peptidoglycan-associated protein